MKFYLVENKRIELTTPYNKNIRYSISTSITNHPDNHASPQEMVKFNKFKRAFDQKYGNVQENSPLAIEFKLSCESSSTNQAWDISIEGNILKAVHQILCCGSKSEVLEIQLKAQFTDGYGRQISQGVISAPELWPYFETDDEKIDIPTKYQCVNVKIPAIDSSPYYKQSKWEISVKIDKQNFICVADIIPAFSEINQKILEDEKFCDFQIMTDDNNGDPNPPLLCHKTFLCANSAVFTRMLEGNFGEASENQMKMKGMSYCGVEALLKFIYYSDVTDALESSEISLELLKAADKYDIQVLWKVITGILTEEPHAWYDVDMALGLFDFVRNRESDNDNQTLMKKVIQVLALKSEQLPKSKLYAEIFSNPIARDMFHLALATNKP